MNWLDIVLLLILGLSIAAGILKGFARLLVGLAAAIAGLVCGLWFYGAAASLVLPYVSYPGLANFLGFLIIFVLAVAAGALLGKLLGMLLKWAGLSWVDRLLGGVFGLARGMVFAVALVLALMAFTREPPPQSVVHSRLAPYMIGVANLCAYLAPHDVRQGVHESYEKARALWEEVAAGAGKARRKRGPPVIR